MPVTEDNVEVEVLPFGIQADHPRNCDLLIQCIPGARLRSALDGSKGSFSERTGEYTVPLDQSRHLAAAPKIPGQELHVNPLKLTYKIVDPLCEKPELLTRLEKFLAQTTGRSIDGKLRGVPAVEGTLDPHQMKTLCREMWNLVQAKEARLVKGAMPDIDDIQGMAGHFLLNPGSIVPNTQPRYEKDFAAWVERLSSNGG